MNKHGPKVEQSAEKILESVKETAVNFSLTKGREDRRQQSTIPPKHFYTEYT